MRDLEPFLVFTDALERAGLQYFVTGSVASIVYGEPRLTHDIDVVLNLGEGGIDKLIAAFPEELFYVPPREALQNEVGRDLHGHFNLVHLATGYRADVYLLSPQPLHQWAFPKRRKIALEPAGQLWLAPPEYVILRKLEFFREGGSEKHLRDIQGMLSVSGDQINREDIEHWVTRLGLRAEWEKARKA